MAVLGLAANPIVTWAENKSHKQKCREHIAAFLHPLDE